MKKESRLSRRNLLLAAGGMAAVGALAATSLKQVVAQRALALIGGGGRVLRTPSLATGSYEVWLAQVGSVFALAGGGNIRLAGVRALASSGIRPPGCMRNRAFVAVFDPLGGRTMAGDLIYTATHPRSGPLSIFLSAATDPRTPARMLAVFN